MSVGGWGGLVDDEPNRLPFVHFSNRRPSTAASSFPSETEHVFRGADGSTLGGSALQDLERRMRRVDSILLDDMPITATHPRTFSAS